MENITLSSNLVNATAQYLATKPYAEVAQLMAAFQQEIKEQPEAAKPVSEQVQLNG